MKTKTSRSCRLGTCLLLVFSRLFFAAEKTVCTGRLLFSTAEDISRCLDRWKKARFVVMHAEPFPSKPISETRDRTSNYAGVGGGALKAMDP